MLNEEIVIDIIPLSLCPLLQWQRVTSVVTPEPSNVAHKRGHITPTLARDQIFDANVYNFEYSYIRYIIYLFNYIIVIYAIQPQGC